MELTTVWFLLIAFLWTGYFVLEGFDFGVGMLMGILGRNDRERRVVINTIGPHFDGNEVWLIVAGGATFAAFPDWYAALFSGFYLPLLMILVGLIIRLVAIDYRSKRADLAWRRRWDVGIVVGSLLPALLWGVAFGNIVRGVPIDAHGDYVGGFLNLLNPFALLSGLVTLTLFLTHGAVFVALKTDGVIRARAARFARRFGPVALLLTALVLGLLGVNRGGGLGWLFSAVAVLAIALALVANQRGREGWAFVGTATGIVLLFVTVFAALFPAVLPSSLDPAWDLTVVNASSSAYTLKIMTWAAALITPFVLAYQAWSYWVFRKRLTISSIADDSLPEPSPVLR